MTLELVVDQTIMVINEGSFVKVILFKAQVSNWISFWNEVSFLSRCSFAPVVSFRLAYKEVENFVISTLQPIPSNQGNSTVADARLSWAEKANEDGSN